MHSFYPAYIVTCIRSEGRHWGLDTILVRLLEWKYFRSWMDYHAIFHIDEHNLGIMCPNDLQVKACC